MDTNSIQHKNGMEWMFYSITKMKKTRHGPCPENMNMDIIALPHEYYPGTDNNGKYVDEIPACAPDGIVCPCGSRKNYAYTRTNFRVHVQCDTHRRWIHHLNTERQNYYREAMASRVLIRDSHIKIAKMQKEIDKLRAELFQAVHAASDPIPYTETCDLIELSD